MSDVSAIYALLARNAGAAAFQRGSTYGDLVNRLSQVPLEVANQRAADAIHAHARMRQDAEDARAAAQDARQAAANQRDQAAVEYKAIVNKVLDAASAPSGNPLQFDADAAFAMARQLGHPEATRDAIKAHREQLPKLTQLNPANDTYADNVLVQPGVTKQPAPPAPSAAGFAAAANDPTKTPEERAAATAALATLQRPATPAAPALGSSADYIARYAKEKGLDPAAMTTAQTDAALKAHRDATQRPPVLGGMNTLYAETDPKAIADQIRKGEMSPIVSEYGRPVQGAIASVLAKPGPNGEKPFNLASAQREWKAQINLNRTMNGSQQVRLDESIRSGLAMYDKVDELATKWDGMGIGPLSRANLAAARDGLKGKAAQSIANQLTGQIGQLTSDVATIEQGGLTPTNESRAIAEKSMQDWWSKGTIHDMTAQGRYNMQIRHLARGTQAPMVPGNGVDTSPAVPATPAAAPMQQAIPGVPGAIAESTDGGKTWHRVK